jgi:hypothetical protein
LRSLQLGYDHVLYPFLLLAGGIFVSALLITGEKIRISKVVREDETAMNMIKNKII